MLEHPLVRNDREARRLIEAWRIDYNESRRHMALGNISPNEYACRAMTSTDPGGCNRSQKLTFEVDHQTQALQPILN